MHRFVVRPSAMRVTAAAGLSLTLLAPIGDPGVVVHRLIERQASIGAVGAAEAQTRTRRSRTRSTTRRVAARPAAPPAASWTSPFGAPALSNDFASMINGRIRSGKFGVMVVSLTRGDTLFAHAAGDKMQPASTMKLFSAAVALDRFGAEHRFSTDVLRDSQPVAGGVVAGNLYLRGDGDPSMSARFWKDPNLPMATLARSIAAAGVTRVRGDLIFDATAFDDQKIPEGWKTSYLGSAYAARVSALSLNENVVWVAVRPEGGTARVELEPASSTIPLTSTVRVVRGSGGRIVARQSGDGIVVSGSVGANSGPLRYSLVVPDPALFTAGALHAALRNAGVTVDGTVKPGKTPDGAVKVAAFASPPMSQILSEMNRESINVVAELVYRAAARASAPDSMSTAQASLTNLREFMSKKVGADPGQITASDGSGLSLLDSLTPRSMIQLLSYAHRGPWSSAFHGSLPVAGESELLRRRMRSTPAQGNLHAKTGTTDTVIGLGGYVTAKNGEIMAFSFIYNGSDRWNAKSAMDAMGATLANFVRE
jgi:serine-type D-Ala-D-Ala carboxypeptidase/endopeptidase (penicillin-binding protein 4)